MFMVKTDNNNLKMVNFELDFFVSILGCLVECQSLVCIITTLEHNENNNNNNWFKTCSNKQKIRKLWIKVMLLYSQPLETLNMKNLNEYKYLCWLAKNQIKCPLNLYMNAGPILKYLVPFITYFLILSNLVISCLIWSYFVYLSLVLPLL